MRPLDDGRVVLYGSPDASSADYSNFYDQHGMPRRPTTRFEYDFLAYGADGAVEILPTAQVPDGTGRTGGADVSANGQRFAQICDTRRTPEDFSDDVLTIYDGGAPTSETSMTDLLAHAPTVPMRLPARPIMPGDTDEPHSAESRGD